MNEKVHGGTPFKPVVPQAVVRCPSNPLVFQRTSSGSLPPSTWVRLSTTNPKLQQPDHRLLSVVGENPQTSLINEVGRHPILYFFSVLTKTVVLSQRRCKTTKSA